MPTYALTQGPRMGPTHRNLLAYDVVTDRPSSLRHLGPAVLEGTTPPHYHVTAESYTSSALKIGLAVGALFSVLMAVSDGPTHLARLARLAREPKIGPIISAVGLITAVLLVGEGAHFLAKRLR